MQAFNLVVVALVKGILIVGVVDDGLAGIAVLVGMEVTLGSLVVLGLIVRLRFDARSMVSRLIWFGVRQVLLNVPLRRLLGDIRLALVSLLVRGVLDLLLQLLQYLLLLVYA